MNHNVRRLKCMIVDDEPNAIEVIVHHLSNFPQFEITGMFRSGLEAKQFLKVHTIDLIFLDIQMPGISGLDFLRSLVKPPAIFLTTAYRHYAPEAFDLEVLDYLLKPISFNRFQKAILKFEKQNSDNHPEMIYTDDTIVVRANRSDVRLKYNDIYYLEAMGDYVKIHLESKQILTKETLRNLLSLLPRQIFRQIHRGFVVNKNKIIAEASHYVEISNKRLPISRSFR